MVIKKYPSCFFKYMSNTKLDNAYTNDSMQYSVVFKDNVVISEQHAYYNLPFTHCSWLPNSAFKTAIIYGH